MGLPLGYSSIDFIQRILGNGDGKLVMVVFHFSNVLVVLRRSYVVEKESHLYLLFFLLNILRGNWCIMFVIDDLIDRARCSMLQTWNYLALLNSEL